MVPSPPACSYAIRRPSVSPVSVPSRHTTASQTSRTYSRSLPIPPTRSYTKLSVPTLPIIPNRSSPSYRPHIPTPGPSHSTEPHPPPFTIPRSPPMCLLPRVAARLQPTVKLTPNYSASAHDPFPYQLRLAPRFIMRV